MLNSFQLPISDLYNISSDDFDCGKSWLLSLDYNEWFVNLWNDRGLINGNKLCTYRLFKNSLSAESYVSTLFDMSQRSIFSKFRCGTLPLQVELGRFSRPVVPLEDRICKHCNSNSIEDEVHFLTSCSLYSDLRYDLWNTVSVADPSFPWLSPVDQLVYLMNNGVYLQPLAALLSSMYRRRQSHL